MRKENLDVETNEAIESVNQVLDTLRSFLNGTFYDHFDIEKRLSQFSYNSRNTRDYYYYNNEPEPIYPNIISNFTEVKKLLSFTFRLDKI